MKKCIASKDGVCQNIYAFGLKCDGYSWECKLKPHYDNISNVYDGIVESFRRGFGIKGDKSDD